MKRSEMVQHIANTLEQTFDRDNTWTLTAEFVLDCCELYGMLPPFNQEAFIKSKNQYGIESADGNEWENETGPKPGSLEDK
jgi:hypothetical protein